MKKVQGYRDLTVKRGVAGLGLFTTVPRARGERIIEYTGEKVTEEEANRRGGKYLFEINDAWTIDGKGRENLARYVNHSCKPNCYAEVDEDEERIFIYAKRKIAPGEELCYDYGKVYIAEYIRGNCRCAACQAAR